MFGEPLGYGRGPYGYAPAMYGGGAPYGYGYYGAPRTRGVPAAGPREVPVSSPYDNYNDYAAAAAAARQRAAPVRRTVPIVDPEDGPRPARRTHYEDEDAASAEASDLVTDGVNVYKPVYSRYNPYEPVSYRLVGPLQGRRAPPKQAYEHHPEPVGPTRAQPVAPHQHRHQHQHGHGHGHGQQQHAPAATAAAATAATAPQPTAAAPKSAAKKAPAVAQPTAAEQRAARTIQRAFRTHRDRRRAQAARVLQPVVRGFLARRQVAAVRQRLQALAAVEQELATLLERREGVVYGNTYMGENGRPRWAALEFEDALTKMLIKADGVLSVGHGAVRQRRKHLISAINRELERFDRFRSGAAPDPISKATAAAAAAEAGDQLGSDPVNDSGDAKMDDDPVNDAGDVKMDDEADDKADDVKMDDKAGDEAAEKVVGDEAAEKVVVDGAAAGKDEDEDMPSSVDGRFRASTASDVAGGSDCAADEATPGPAVSAVTPPSPTQAMPAVGDNASAKDDAAVAAVDGENAGSLDRAKDDAAVTAVDGDNAGVKDGDRDDQDRPVLNNDADRYVLVNDADLGVLSLDE